MHFQMILKAMKEDKQFMNEVIEGLGQSDGEFSHELITYVIENYEPDYGTLLNNLFANVKFHENIASY